MPGFNVHTGTLAVLDENDVDTDRIIPARFLTMVTKRGYGELLFKDVRGAGFPLDRPEAQGASILVVGSNFGCGSSREHAVWAIQQAGYAAVIAKRTAQNLGYSDIFRSNAGNCGLLLIELAEADHARLVAAGQGTKCTVDLPAQRVVWDRGEATFDMDPVTKEAMIEGRDLIGRTLVYADEIAHHEAKLPAYVSVAR